MLIVPPIQPFRMLLPTWLWTLDGPSITPRISFEFYARDERGIPRRWVARMRESMARLTPTFSTNRVVRQYTDEHYLSAAAAFRGRAENGGSLGADLVAWQAELAKHWSALRFGSATVQQQGEQYLFEVQVFLDDINPDAVRVELYAEAQKDAAQSRNS
jgi:glycogen phosphorylase